MSLLHFPDVRKTAKRSRLQQLWLYLSKRTSTDISPSYRTIMRDLGYSTISLLATDLDVLEELGYVKRIKGGRRAITVRVPFVEVKRGG